jgi:hypothetical protein
LDDIYGNVGSNAATNQKLYERAKKYKDFAAALDVILRCLSQQKLDGLKELRRYSKDPLLFVYPQVLDPSRGSNAIPSVLCQLLADKIGGEVCYEINQVTTQKRAGLSRLARFVCQPKFNGSVVSGRRYVLVDDVITSGASFVALRSHIVRNGGVVGGITALAHVTGKNQKLPISPWSVRQLKVKFGEGIAEYWGSTFGHRLELMTEQDARYLLHKWSPTVVGVEDGRDLLECLRKEINDIGTAIAFLNNKNRLKT